MDHFPTGSLASWSGCSAPVAAVELHRTSPPLLLRFGAQTGKLSPSARCRVASILTSSRSIGFGSWREMSAPVAAVQSHALHLPWDFVTRPRMGMVGPIAVQRRARMGRHPLAGTGGAGRRTRTSPPRTDQISVDLRPFGGTPPSGATLRKLDQKTATGCFVNSPQVRATTGTDGLRR